MARTQTPTERGISAALAEARELVAAHLAGLRSTLSVRENELLAHVVALAYLKGSRAGASEMGAELLTRHHDALEELRGELDALPLAQYERRGPDGTEPARVGRVAFYDSDDKSNRRRVLELWTDASGERGRLYHAERHDAGDVWPAMTLLGHGFTVERAEEMARERGLTSREDERDHA